MPVISISYGEIQVSRSIDPRTPEDVAKVVESYFADVPIMVQVARCESQYRHTLADGTVLRGTVDKRDTGVMQINTYYHGATAKKLGLNLENIVDNMAYARDLYERSGTQPWSASKACWGKTQTVAMK